MILSEQVIIKRKHSRIRFLALCLISMGLAIVTLSKTSAYGSVISPLAEEPKVATVFSLFKHAKDPQSLKKTIKTSMDKISRNYSVYIKDFNSDFQIGIDESVIYTAASVNKIPILAALYYYVQKGDIDLDREITLQADDIQDYGTGTIRYDPVGSVYSIKTLARLMLQKSDNTAAYIISNQILSVDKIQALVTSWGMTQTDIINNKTSNKDMEIVLEKIYNGGVANSANTQEMLSFLKDSDYEDRLPAELPKGVTVYHKIGSEVNTMHDVGIVEHGKTKYYIGIMTGDVISEPDVTKTIADISKITYDYLQ